MDPRTGMDPRAEHTQPARARHDVASFGTYAEAQRAVDTLADRRFPVEHLSIVAEGLRFVEQVTGRRGYVQAAVSGASTGALAGAFLGFFFGLFDWVDPLVSGLALALYGLVFGAVLGALFGLAGHALTAGRRDFSSVGGMQAERYDLVADDADVAARARQELAGRSAGATARGANPGAP